MSLENISSYFPAGWENINLTETIVLDSPGMYDFSNKVYVWKGVGDVVPLWICANDITVMNFVINNDLGQNGIKITNCSPEGDNCAVSGPNNLKLISCIGISNSDFLVITPRSGKNYSIDNCVFFSKTGKGINLNNVYDFEIKDSIIVSAQDAIISNGKTSGSVVNNTFYINPQNSILSTQNINAWTINSNTTNQFSSRQVASTQSRDVSLNISIGLGFLILVIIIAVILYFIFRKKT